MSSKYQYFNGLKFTRDDKTGYYLNSTIEKRMHRYVWEFYNGPIPKGYDIHHKDEDKANNEKQGGERAAFKTCDGNIFRKKNFNLRNVRKRI